MSHLRLPAPVDPHVHLRDLDWSHKSTFESETAAALAGGYWAVLDMPNTPPATTTTARLADKVDRLGAAAHCDFGAYVGADVERMDAYVDAAPAAIGLKMYCDATTGDLLVDDDASRATIAAAWSAATTRPMAVHAEGDTVEAMLAHVRAIRVRTHFCHISEAAELALLRAAKAEGLPVTVGVTPHHLYLTEDDGRRLGPRARVKPPLKGAADLAALWEGIDDGTVDLIESDHAPHAEAEKASADPPHGLPGLETTLPLMILALHESRIDADRLVALVATNAQRIYGLTPPLETFTLVDPDASYVIRDDAIRSATGWSPFSGMRVWGRVVEVRIRGSLAFDGERVLSAPGSGRSVA